MANNIFIPIISGFNPRGVYEAEKAMAGLKGSFKSLKAVAIQTAVAFAAVGTVQFFGDAVTQAKDLERNTNALKTVFGDMAPVMETFAKNATDIGLSQTDASRASAFLGTVLKSAGFDMDTVASQTQNLVGLASDLAVTYGYDVQEALTGMTALFRGEYDPIEKFGVAMKQSEVNSVLAAKGQDKLQGAARRNAEQIARLGLLYQRTTDAQGQFKAQSGTLFVEQSKIAASFKNLQAAAGKALTKPLATVMEALTPILDMLQKPLEQLSEMFGKVITYLTPVMEPLGELLVTIFDALMPILDLIMAILTPLMPLIVAIAKLFNSIIKPLIPIIKFLADVLMAMIVPVVGVVSFVLTAIVDGISKFIDWLANLGWADVLGDVGKAFRDIADSMDISKLMQKNTDGTDKFAKKIKNTFGIDSPTGGNSPVGKAISKTQEFKNALLDLVKGFKIAGTATREIGKFESQTIDYFQKIQDKLKEGFSGGLINKKTFKALKDYARQEAKVLGDIARQRDDLAKRLEDARGFIVDTKSAVVDFGNITGLLDNAASEVTRSLIYMSGRFQVIVSDTFGANGGATALVESFQNVLDKTRAFADDIKLLAKYGLNKELFGQIISAGVDAGSATADAIVAGGPAMVQALNDTFAELDKVAGQISETSAEVMYGAGVDLSNGLIAGLMAQETELMNTAKALAKSFRNAFKAEMTVTIPTSPGGNPTTVNNTYNITVESGMSTGGTATGKAIVDAIKKYEKANGKVWTPAN